MHITFSINENQLTVSGKPTVKFVCEHCKSWLDAQSHLMGFFYQSSLPKEDFLESLGKFIEAINNKNVEQLFLKASTGRKVYNHVCNCDEKLANVVDMEYLKHLANARRILREGLKSL